ncbi:MAG: outer membrane beta-barrel protein [Ignavibacteria bacterium]|nr:outer membrane beta-barrel protein [Ignavibacteria bacterium]MBK6418947.1 outer membrane beta-barrel protein [Ignavibacteria bacterium]MBK6760364.1 outer membrane beta-barrel protein [Ignavibacteria bacterium]MBK7186624.1 outer membrane beta-barrel protein [Ignavibacteria bacterium]MBK7411853.1 outer membrane beta-barrel protein [Ignavibacteria bacterium]
MKRHILLFLAMVMSIIGASAQVHLGLTGYVQNLSLNGDSPEDQTITAGLGYGAGVSAGYFFTPEIQLTLGAGYDVRNNTVSNVLPLTDSLDAVGDFSLTSYAVPIGIRIYGAAQTWYFSSGITIRFHDVAKVEVIEPDTSINISSAFVKMEGSIYLGFGYMFRVGDVRLIPELRYEQGLSNLLNGEPLYSLPPAPVLRSSGFSFRFFAEYAFGGGQ